LATFPAERNPAALIVEFCLRRLVECWASPPILDEYCHVLAEEPDFLAEFLAVVEVCYPLTEIHVIGHEPDNRFLECALATGADFLVTVNTAPGHFEQKHYGSVCVVTPGEFVNLRQVRTFFGRAFHRLLQHPPRGMRIACRPSSTLANPCLVGGLLRSKMGFSLMLQR